MDRQAWTSSSARHGQYLPALNLQYDLPVKFDLL
jgi:hypothetical protein